MKRTSLKANLLLAGLQKEYTVDSFMTFLHLSYSLISDFSNVLGRT